MKPLNLGILVSITETASTVGVSPDNIFHEHTAFRVVESGAPINGRVWSTALTITGTGLMKIVNTFRDANEKPHTIFLQGTNCPSIRWELLGQPDVPNHEAFRVLELVGCKRLCDALAARPEFKHLSQFDVENDMTYAQLFEFKGTETVIQIIWRHPDSVFFEGDQK